MFVLILKQNLKFKKINFSFKHNLFKGFLKRDLSDFKKINEHVRLPFSKLPNNDEFEPFWYNVWESKNYFKLDENNLNEEKFSMILPPPNITGDLHIGHAFTVAIQDAIFRFKKINNPNLSSVYLPGYDHAGIGMFSVLDKIIWSKHSKRLSELSEEEFKKITSEWKEDRIKSIRNQLKLLGASLDFSKERFTLDKEMSKSVSHAFVELFEKGLIYRDIGIVNWCFHLNSTISDIEIDWINVEKKTLYNFVNNQKHNIGVLYDLAFKIENSDQEIVVSTTRPYTIPGDVAIAVNPKDERYLNLVGKKAINPLTNKLMPIITDLKINPNVGTGAVKITPACSLTDFKISQNNNLNIIEILDSKGNIDVNILDTKYKYLNGLNRYTANEKILEIFKNLNLYKKEYDYATKIPVCSKTGDLIEYKILPQWYLNIELANEYIKEKVLKEEIKFLPLQHKNTFLDWIKENKPWCISRQINWGHKIPIYKIKINDNEKFVAATSLEEAKDKIEKLYKIKDLDSIKIEQEKDVMDTWFSSSLLPFCYFGWPNTENDFYKNFYPLSIMETGYDILKFWIHKMLITSYYLTNQLPFKNILLHGMIVDERGKKMSKSLGNVIDPIDFKNGITLKSLQNKLKETEKNGLIDKNQLKEALEAQKKLYPKGLPKNSADGLRLFMYHHDLKYEYFKMDSANIIKNRNLINKIWQSFNFFLILKQNLNDENINFDKKYEIENVKNLKTIDRWILSSLALFTKKSKLNYEDYNLHLVHENFLNFYISSFCDFYLELIKPSLYNEKDDKIKLIRFNILKYSLKTMYSVIHPLIPFITEELFQKIKLIESEINNMEYNYESIMTTTYPDEDFLDNFIDKDLQNHMDIFKKCISKIRWINTLIKTNKLNEKSLTYKIESTDDIALDFLDSLYNEFNYLTKKSNIKINFDPPFILNDESSTEFTVDNFLILNINYNLQIVVNSSEFDLSDFFKKYMKKEMGIIE